jgi:phosphatidylinositol dimannoside acyltransferase
LPERFAYWAAESLGGVAARRSRKRGQVERNMARASGLSLGSSELDRVVTAAYRSYARYWLETFRLVRETRTFFIARFTCHGAERIDAVLARGKGSIVVVGHLGNWDAAGAWAGATGRAVTTVAEVLRPRRLFDFFAAHRATLGITIHPAEPGVTAALVRAVEDGRVVAILGDRDLGGRGPEVELFGEKVTLPAGPASIALRTGVPLLVAGVYGTVLPGGKRGWEAFVSEPIELPDRPGPHSIRDLTQRLAVELERAIARRPEEWHMFQPLWSADRSSS